MATARRTFLLGLLAAGTLPLSGCITRYIFSPDTYTEQVSSALISQDGKNIIVATDHYHYIFASDPAIIRVLKSRAHKAVTANFTGFKVGANGETEGSVVLSLPGDDPAIAQEAQKIGFTQGEDKDYTEIIHMQGTRYRASDLKFSDSYALNKRGERVSSMKVNDGWIKNLRKGIVEILLPGAPAKK